MSGQTQLTIRRSRGSGPRVRPRKPIRSFGDFPNALITTRGEIRNIRDAARLISRELPEELKRQSRWTFAAALLKEAERTHKTRDLSCAYRQLRQALENDHMLRT
jgi:hypothetical protein